MALSWVSLVVALLAYVSLAAAATCSGPVVISAPNLNDTGSFANPSPWDGVSKYASQSNCSWLVSASGTGTRISLTSTAFSVGCLDVLEIFDGANAGAPLVARLNCSAATPVTFKSSGNATFLRFTANSTNVFTGFYFTYRVYQADNCSGLYQIAAPVGGAGTLGQALYPPNTNCSWNVTAPAGYRLFAQLASINIGNFSTVRIYDGTSNASSRLVYTLNNARSIPAPVPKLLSTGTSLFIALSSAVNPNAGTQGFTLSYSVVPITATTPCQASTSITGGTGTIQSHSPFTNYSTTPFSLNEQ